VTIHDVPGLDPRVEQRLGAGQEAVREPGHLADVSVGN
jgi:hypothetical protein